ncbi:MAG: hydroxymethylbilane synthase [Planctomycetaceae bacterium]|jgi:hydroxymethylbilane synthase|nr:hydroxymethylbilane synthase [Planctomycetaceae bacterium]
MTIRFGTRGSILARWQTNWCVNLLKEKNIDSKIVIIETSGDRVPDKSIANIGAQGVFTKEIQSALLRHEIDVAVHSLKDLPTEPVAGLVLASVLKRDSFRDAFLSHKATVIEELPKGSRIGTGSLRRKTQIIYRFGNLFQIDEIRGNIETRLHKLDQGEYNALILSEAGLVRLGLSERICSFLELPFFLPAVGQGAIGLEIRLDDLHTAEQIAPLGDTPTFTAVLAERAMLQKLQGGCIAPIAALGRVEGEMLVLQGRILSLDGKTMFETTLSTPISNDPNSLGIAVANELVKMGADTILDEIRQQRQFVLTESRM